MTVAYDTRWHHLVRAIQEAPDDDAPRLVAADWLSERNDPRGEHVALQCEHFRLDAADPRRAAIEARLAEIDPSPWLEPLHRLGANGGYAGRTQDPLRLLRGFVERATLEGRAVGAAGALLRQEPITDLTLVSGGPAPSAQAAAAPELARLRGLTLTGRHSHGQDALIRSPHLAGLRSLAIIAMNQVVLEALPELVARPERWIASIDDRCAAKLAACGGFARAVYLSLGNRALGDPGVVALAGSPLDALEELDLSDSQVTARGLAALGPRLGRLTRLGLSRCALTPEVVGVLIEHAGGGRLRRLDLGGVSRLEVVDALLDSPVVASLEALDLRHASYSQLALQLYLARSKMRRIVHMPQVDWTSNDAICEAFPGLELTPDEGW